MRRSAALPLVGARGGVVAARACAQTPRFDFSGVGGGVGSS
jgi:hypothetical protein